MGVCKSLLLAALMSLLLLHLCSKSEAASTFDCCLQYTERAIPAKFIRGYVQQLANEACDIEAVIFYTKKRICCVCRSKEEMGETCCECHQPESQEDVKTDPLWNEIGCSPRTKRTLLELVTSNHLYTVEGLALN